MYWTAHLEGGPRRVNHAAVAVGDYIYSFGGYRSGNPNDYLSEKPMDIHVLNTNNLRWSLVPMKKDETGQNLKYPEVPFQRYGHTAVAYDSKIYIWGGRNDDIACNILFCYDVKIQKWTTPTVTGNIPGARDGHTACIANNKMYIFGGFEDEIDLFTWDVYYLNLDTMQWYLLQTNGEPPSYRDFHTATVFNDRMYIFGGRGDRQGPRHSQEEIYTTEIVYLDLKTLEWHTPAMTGKVPVGRRSHSAFVYNDMIYIFGGYNGILDQHFNDLYAYNIAQKKWNVIKPRGLPPKARRRQVCLVIGKKLYLFGGTSPTVDGNSSSGSGSSIISNADSNQKLIDYDDTHVLDFEPTLKTLAIMTVLENNLDQSCLPNEIRWEIRTMTLPNRISRLLSNTG